MHRFKKAVFLVFTLIFSVHVFGQTDNAPVVTATGNQIYCPGTSIPIVTDFTITDVDDTTIDEFFIQISKGYQFSFDRLSLSGNVPAVVAAWDANTGRLTLQSSTQGQGILLTDLETIVKQVVFTSTATNIEPEKEFSLSVTDANYLPFTDHFYEFIESADITWTDARAAAEQRFYYGRQGYLATLTSQIEADFAGKQAQGTGWIGGSDEEQEGVWKWMTGPEAGTVFWNGLANGSSPPGQFAFWNNGEPNSFGGNEDYAHITDPSIGIPGAWNDLPNTGSTDPRYAAKGYIVEYGRPGDPPLNIAASTRIYIPQITSAIGGQTCPNGSVTISASVSEGEVYWFDAETGGNLISTGTTFTTPLLANTTIFFAAAGPSDCSSTTRVPVEVTVNPIPQVNDDVAIQFCEADRDGLGTFDLTSVNQQISNNAANETFSYFLTEDDANNNTNPINDPTNYNNQTSSYETVWVRTTNATNCFTVSRINLQITSTIIPNTFSRTYDECDDYIDDTNDDLDGITTFNFGDITADIIDLFPAPQRPTLSVTYFETELDATNNTNEITDITNYRNTTPNSQEIFVRVTNSINNACVYVGSHLTLNVTPVPTIINLDEFNVCDDDADGDDTNGFVQNIDLESRTPLILGTQDPSLFTVTYHETAADATAGSNALSSPYTNRDKDSQTIYVRVVENSTGCFVDRNSFTLNVRPLPSITNIVELKQCDTDTDGFSPFNLLEASTDISTNYANETFEFYESLPEAISGLSPIGNPTAFVNRNPTSDIVWARAISQYGCYRIAQVNLTVSTTGIPPTFQRTFTVCDDLLDGDDADDIDNDDTDGIATFDFSSVTGELRSQYPASQQLTITYYRNLADAFAEQNAILDPTNYRNIGYPNSQDIYVRIDSDLDNDCLGLGHHVTLVVEPVPVANTVTDIEECDDALSGSTIDGRNANINLRSKVADILGPTQSEADYNVTFHTTLSGASDGTSDLITNDTSYTSVAPAGFTQGTTSEQIIYVRVTSRNGQTCYNANTSFKIIVRPIPTVSTTIVDLPVCDIATPTDSDPRNRIAQNIDLTVKDAEILDGRSGYVVEYYIRQQDAETRQNRILDPTNFENTTAETTFPANFNTDDPGIQTIFFVVVDQNGLQCPSVFSTFNLVINPEPSAADPITVISECDDANDGDDTNGIIQDIDLNGKIPEILGAGKNPNDFTVTFHSTQADAQSGSAALPSPYTNSNRTETIYVRIVNNNSGCVNSNASFDLIINDLPSFSVTTPQILCLNDLPLNISVENPADVYFYEWRTPDGTLLGTSDNLDINAGGSYDVTATNTVTNCSRTERIVVNESNVATLLASYVTIVDESNNLGASNTLSVSIDTINNNLGPGDYQFALLNTETNNRIPFAGYQDEPLFEGIEGGIYQIIVNDKNGCVPDATLLISVLQFPKFFTPNGDGQNDFWVIKGANKTFYPNSSIDIFNRYGKLVAQFEVGDQGWDGTFNGRVLPQDDYWYKVTLISSDPNRPAINRTGNFSLLRR